MAGTGKSTISRSLAGRLQRSGRLGASFFFKRGERDRGVSSKLFTTISSQLTRGNPALAPFIKKAKDDDPDIGTKGVSDQFDKLISNPLSKFSSINGAIPCIVILIDALDECELRENVDDKAKLLISLLTRAD